MLRPAVISWVPRMLQISICLTTYLQGSQWAVNIDRDSLNSLKERMTLSLQAPKEIPNCVAFPPMMYSELSFSVPKRFTPRISSCYKYEHARCVVMRT